MATKKDGTQSAATQQRSVRVPQELWTKALGRASKNGTSLAAAINAFLVDYTAPVKRGPRKAK
ncbi:hypothetical protein UFOVP1616_4 [uncultured Caudovirales phage]|uniref:Uncharacterized protein n=1 Tax=uncultured Caudovirales phage TaxID=2100421 RepID=A0A6J5SKN0_9CAUD|nr:hypothetical protein UFOVP1467_20 [uncultured Caudovirales phage]CAB4219621.1 hypothetical protein UFOVP1616_4 [uncultured Caudovirales phage]